MSLSVSVEVYSVYYIEYSFPRIVIVLFLLSGFTMALYVVGSFIFIIKVLYTCYRAPIDHNTGTLQV